MSDPNDAGKDLAKAGVSLMAAGIALMIAVPFLILGGGIVFVIVAMLLS